jgi:hypothetical protein
MSRIDAFEVRRGRLVRAALVMAMTAALSVTGYAYQEYGVTVGSRTVMLKWQNLPVDYWVTNGSVPGVTNDQLQAAVQRAFATWQNVPTASLSAQFAGATTALPFNLNGYEVYDGMTVVGFVDLGGQPDAADVLGETGYWLDMRSGAIIESDIVLNSAFPWTVASNGEANHYDLESIALHEIGHLWGLGHSALGETEQVGSGRRVIAKGSVMFPIAFSPGTTDRVLQADDIAGISDLYPTTRFRTETGSVNGTVKMNGSPVYGAHVVAFNPQDGKMVGGFTDSNGLFLISGLSPGPVYLRVEPLDDADLDSFFDDTASVDVNFRITYYNQWAIVGAGGATPLFTIQVTPK